MSSKELQLLKLMILLECDDIDESLTEILIRNRRRNREIYIQRPWLGHFRTVTEVMTSYCRFA